MLLKNKNIIVTGASDGIGRQIAIQLARENTNLALVARDEKELEETQKESERAGAGKVDIYPCDLRDAKQIKETINKIVSDFDKIDVLINDAGIWQKMMPVENVEESVVDDVIQTNLVGLINCTRFLLPYLKKQKDSAIINIVSKSGVVPQIGQSVYSASKYGVRGFTEVLKAELKGSGVRVAGIYQSGTNTKLFAKVGDNPPLEKFTNPKDLANVIVFMLSQPAKIWLHEVHVEY